MKKKINGYITVELSLLFPIILLVLCTLFYMCFCFHDKVILFESIYGFGINTDNKMTDKENEEKLRQTLQEKMLISKVSSVKYSKEEHDIRSGVKILINIPLTLWENEVYETKIKIVNLNKADIIRKCRAVKEVVW